ncbi:efflux transporter outer membrane subunit [Chromobacterium vaccinii]|uniref:efflux transporter outer membrane subunit n=1 Tax=Chromobacterium vaccinii TaxID=1108595 RepID=UPI003C709904
MIKAQMLLPLAASLWLAGCAVPPPDSRTLALEHAALPDGWRAASAAGRFDADMLGFPIDARLRGLIAEAVRHNADLRMAAARMEQAQAALKAAGGAMLPSVAIGGQAGNSSLPTSSMSTSGTALIAAWEVDLWGRLAAEKDAAHARLQASELDLAYARQSIAAGVVRGWIAVAESTQQLTIAQRMLSLSQRQLALIEQARKVGRDTELDVDLHRANTEAQRQQLLASQQAQEQARRALELLLGRYPGAELSAAGALPAVSDTLPAGIPSELLSRRPDLLASRQRFEAAFYGVEAAKRARLPSLKLSGGVAYIADSAVLLKSGIDNPVWAATGQMLAPIFTGGQLQAQIEAQNARQREAVAGYNRAALNALAEVENGLAGERLLGQRERALQAQTSALAKAVAHAGQQRRVGKISQYQLLQQELSLDAAEAGRLRLQSQRLDNRIALHLALGGRFPI